MRVIPPLVITDTMFTSTVLETLPAGAVVWAIGTAFAINDYCYVVRDNTTYDVFRSKSAQTGNTPPAANISNAFWQSFGTVQKTWVAGSYSMNDLVTYLHQNWKSLVNSNSVIPGTDVTKWVLQGPSNKFAVLDRLRNTKSVSPNTIVMSIEPGKRADSIALIGLDASSVEIDIFAGGVLQYHVVIQLGTRNTLSWSDYYFKSFTYKTIIQLFNLPRYISARIQITVKKLNGMPGIGEVIVGNSVYIGETQYSAVRDNLNFSQIVRDLFGNLTLLPRRSVPKNNLKVQFKKNILPDILKLIDETNAVPAFWSGLDDPEDPYFEAVETYGIYKQFSLDLSNFSAGMITLELEEM